MIWFMMACGYSAFCFTSTQTTHASLSDTPIKNFNAYHTNALEALFQLGQALKIPLGITVSDRKFLEPTVSFHLSKGKAADVLNAILRSIPKYHWVEKAGIIHIEPEQMPTSTNKLLSFRLARFESPPANLGMLSFQL